MLPIKPRAATEHYQGADAVPLGRKWGIGPGGFRGTTTASGGSRSDVARHDRLRGLRGFAKAAKCRLSWSRPAAKPTIN